jgi:hypothetical protein
MRASAAFKYMIANENEVHDSMNLNRDTRDSSRWYPWASSYSSRMMPV